MGKMTGRFRVVDIMGYYHVQKEVSKLFGGTRWKQSGEKFYTHSGSGWHPFIFKDKKEAMTCMHDNSAKYIENMRLRERGPVVVKDK